MKRFNKMTALAGIALLSLSSLIVASPVQTPGPLDITSAKKGEQEGSPIDFGINGLLSPIYKGITQYGNYQKTNKTNKKLTDKELEGLKGREVLKIKHLDDDSRRFIYETDLPKPYRIIGPGDGVTFDLVEDRLNLNVDKNRIVTGAYYG